jgi:hypothetical protein
MKLGEIERAMNEAKLKMLIKFEKIKLLEDFYNVRAILYLISLAIQS